MRANPYVEDGRMRRFRVDCWGIERDGSVLRFAACCWLPFAVKMACGLARLAMLGFANGLVFCLACSEQLLRFFLSKWVVLVCRPAPFCLPLIRPAS